MSPAQIIAAAVLASLAILLFARLLLWHLQDTVYRRYERVLRELSEAHDDSIPWLTAGELWLRMDRRLGPSELVVALERLEHMRLIRLVGIGEGQRLYCLTQAGERAVTRLNELRVSP